MGGVIILAMLFFESECPECGWWPLCCLRSWWPRRGGGQAPESVLSGEGRIEVVSPAGVATFEGELRAPW